MERTDITVKQSDKEQTALDKQGVWCEPREITVKKSDPEQTTYTHRAIKVSRVRNRHR